MSGLLQDLRVALRILARKPVFTLVIILTLALGIGAGSAMFSIIDALLLRPVDLPDLDRLAMIQQRQQGGEFNSQVSPRNFLDFRADARSFAAMAAYQWWEIPLTGAGEPEVVIGYQVSPGFLDLLGVRPELGRTFAPDEVDGQKENVVVISHALWERRFDRDRGVLGKSAILGGTSFTIVGVMPRDFRLPEAAELWAPLTLSPPQRADRGSRDLGILARLAPGVSLAQADAEMRQMGERHAAQYPEDKLLTTRTVSLVRGMTEDYTRNFIFTLMGAAIFVLLIACANVAHMFLAHTLTRRKELAVRAALGAGRGRIVRQLLTEAALLGITAGLVSLLFAAWSVTLVKAAMPARIVRFIAGWETMGVNGTVLAFALAVGAGVGFVFGIVPAWQVSRTDLHTVLKDIDRGTTAGRATRFLRALLVVVQIVLALVLLSGAGSMVKGFVRMAHPNAGLDGTNVLTLHVTLPDGRYPHRADYVTFTGRVLERMRALPGVEGAAVVRNVPWGNHGWTRSPHPEGRPLRPEELYDVDFRYATPGYTELLRIPRVEGRGIEDGDVAAAPQVAVVSAAAARRMWPGAPAIGKRFRWEDKDDSPWITVVGVVGDIHDRPDEKGPQPTVYVPFAQGGFASLYFVLRTRGEPLALGHAAQAAVYAVDPEQPATEVRTLDMVHHERLAGFRIGSSMMGGFALIALLLAAVGIYGVIATLVTQRTHEIGVRMALGARRGDVLRLILRKGLFYTLLGVVPGLLLSVALVRFMGSLLTGLIDDDAGVYAVITAAVAAMALLGSLVPALRATRVDPLIALREE